MNLLVLICNILLIKHTKSQSPTSPPTNPIQCDIDEPDCISLDDPFVIQPCCCLSQNETACDIRANCTFSVFKATCLDGIRNTNTTTTSTSTSTTTTTTTTTATPTTLPTTLPTTFPTVIPTTLPTIFPTTLPTTLPTTFPTIFPTVIPTIIPTTIPTIIPTFIPTDYPTYDPTKQPTEKLNCTECEVYNLTLISINTNISITDCKEYSSSSKYSSSKHKTKKSYWKKKTKYSDSSSKKGKKLSRSSSSSSSKKSSWSSSSKSSKTSSWYSNTKTKCVKKKKSKKWKSSSWNKNNNCNNWKQTNKKKRVRRRNLLHSSDSSSSSSGGSDSSSDSDDDHDTMPKLQEVCLVYDIGILTERECGTLNNLFLPLCENNKTDFNSSTVSSDDITSLITSIKPIPSTIDNIDHINAIGYRENITNNNSLGILINLISSNITSFELCLNNVSVDSYTNISNEYIDISKNVIFIIDNESSICNSDGLPCLNFVFEEPCPSTTKNIVKSCDCNHGMKSLNVLYQGTRIADKIEVYSNKKDGELLCIFYSVENGKEIQCNAQPSLSKFKSKLYFEITYNDNDICFASFHTSCSQNILNKESDGCSDLKAIGWIDVSDEICDETVNNDIYLDSKDNALIDSDRKSINKSYGLLSNMSIYMKYALLSIMIIFIILMIISFYICIYTQKHYKDKTADQIASEIVGHAKNLTKTDIDHNISPNSKTKMEMENHATNSTLYACDDNMSVNPSTNGTSINGSYIYDNEYYENDDGDDVKTAKNSNLGLEERYIFEDDVLHTIHENEDVHVTIHRISSLPKEPKQTVQTLPVSPNKQDNPKTTYL